MRHSKAAALAALLLVAACGDTETADADAGLLDGGDSSIDFSESDIDVASEVADVRDGSADATPDAAGDGGADGSADAGPSDPLALPEDMQPQGNEFMVVVIPDSQIYAQYFPETFDRHMRWIAEHAEEYRIVFVSHVGDIVNNGGSRPEWEVAKAAYDWIVDIDLPHGFSVAGHDVSGGHTRELDSSCSPFTNTDCEAREYLEFFGPQHYGGRPWFGGASPSGRSNYQVVEVEGMRLLFMHLPQDVPEAEAVWAGEVLDANPGTLVHLTTHRYLFDYRLTTVLPSPLNLLPAGRFNALIYMLGGQSLMYLDGLDANEVFARIGSRPNVWAIHCGHVDAEFNQVARNTAGLPVYEILVDFQDMADGGGGWLRLLHFKPDENKVEVITFSTETGSVRTNGEGFEHSLGILKSYRQAYAADLVEFGLDEEEADELLAKVSVPGPERDEYYESLYEAGRRDSRFSLDVNFQAYIDASR